MILRPDGAPAKKRRTQLTRVDVKTVVEFERWCQTMGLSLDLYCNKCADTHGPSGARCWGNNAPDATAYHLECLCTDRVYGVELGKDREVIADGRRAIGEPKIQVVVP